MCVDTLPIVEKWWILGQGGTKHELNNCDNERHGSTYSDRGDRDLAFLGFDNAAKDKDS